MSRDDPNPLPWWQPIATGQMRFLFGAMCALVPLWPALVSATLRVDHADWLQREMPRQPWSVRQKLVSEAVGDPAKFDSVKPAARLVE